MPLSALYGRVLAAMCMAGALLCGTACLSHHDTAAIDVDPAGWSTPVTLSYDNSDTLSMRDMYLVLRYSADAEPDGGEYVLKAVSPSGLWTTDTLAVGIMLAARGNGLREVRVPFRSDVKLSEAGGYMFAVTPLQKTEGVWSVAVDFRK